MSQYMRLAIQSAREGVLNGEGGPFGACIIDKKGMVLSVTHNTVIANNDPTCHAEMNAIRKASQVLGSHVLTDCTLYTTAEPCPMCLSASYWARIKQIHVGVTRECAASYGFDDAFFYEQVALPENKSELSSQSGMLSEECEKLFGLWKSNQCPLY